MELDRSLLNPLFEGYKLSEAIQHSIEFHELSHKVFQHDRSELLKQDQESYADEILRNELKESPNYMFYLSSSRDIVRLSKKTFEIKLISGPFIDFCVAYEREDSEQFMIFGLNENHEGVLTNGSQGMIHFNLSLDVGRWKSLNAKAFVEDEKELKVLLQRTTTMGNVREAPKEGAHISEESVAFEFYLLSFVRPFELQSFSLKRLGWSLSRPIVSSLLDGRVLLGTCKGINHRICQEPVESFQKVPGAAIENSSLFAELNTDDDLEDSNNFNSAKISDIRHDSEEDACFEYPEMAIVGDCVAGPGCIATSHGVDVAIYDLSGAFGQGKHVSTYSALNYIQSGKPDRKYKVFGRRHAYVIETSRYVHCYKHCAPSCSRGDQIALAFDGQEVLGWSLNDRSEDADILFLLTEDGCFKIAIGN